MNKQSVSISPITSTKGASTINEKINHRGVLGESSASLSSLRFFIALYVFLFHMQIRWPIVHKKYISAFVSQGAVGMTAFFMLSGFILAARYRELELKKYFVARFARIYPVYALGALLTIPWIGVKNLQFSSHDLTFKVLGGLFIVLIDLILLQAWIPSSFSLWNNGGSWSISAEAFFIQFFQL